MSGVLNSCQFFYRCLEAAFYGQNWLEKRRGVGHVKVKGTIYKIRGISQGEEVMAWIQANFPEPKKRKKRRR